MSQIVKNISRPATVGVVAALASMILTDTDGRILGLPASIAYGTAAAGASAIQEVSRDYILTKITNDPATSTVAQFIAPALTGASMVALMAGVNLTAGAGLPDLDILAKGFLIGAGAEAAGGYAQKAIVQPALDKVGMTESDMFRGF